MADKPKEIKMSKAYDPKDVEQRIYSYWEEENLFAPQDTKSDTRFVIPMPPPNVTGSLHLGHAITLTLEDIMVRYHRMKGDDTLWVPGTDHAGIATQAVVERRLQEQGHDRLKMGREKFLKAVWQWKEQYRDNIVSQTKRMGASCDWKRERFTLDAGLSRAVTKVFKDLYDKGLIYQGEYIVNYDTKNDTVISDLEVVYKEQESKLYYIRYFLKAADKSVLIATTRPETMLGDTAVAVHPQDKRYKEFIGKTLILPIMNREIPVVADDRVDPTFGTGAVKITPSHDPLDFEIARTHNLPRIDVIGKDGKMNKSCGKFAGLTVTQARTNIVEYLDNIGNLEKTEPLTNKVGYCERSDMPVEHIVSKQWFVKMKPLAEKALAAVEKGDLNFVPGRFEKTFTDWLENIHDWCISRQLWWGHRIPVHYCQNAKCNHVVIEDTAPEQCPKCKKKEFKQDEDVLDTWFSSALWPFSTLGWPLKTEDFKRFYPASVLETGYDIIFFWVARMVMMGLFCTGEVPFHTVYLHGIVRDEKGRKMSKSLGNGIDPLEVIDQYGADALRMTLTLGNTPGNDVKFSLPKVEGNKHFINKLWNASRFILMSSTSHKSYKSLVSGLKKEDGKFDPATKWILSRMSTIIEDANKGMADYSFSDTGIRLMEFTWNEFCDWYIEISKGIKKDYVQDVLQYCILSLIKLWHPFIPHVTEELWSHFGQKEALIVSAWPTFDKSWKDPQGEEDFAIVMELVRAIRNMRSENNVEPKLHIKASLVTTEKTAFFKKVTPIIVSLARLEELTLIEKKPSGSAQYITGVVPPCEIYIPLKGIVDVKKEKEKLEKEIVKVKDFLSKLKVKLNDQKFTKNAPKNVVKEQEKRLKTEEDRLKKLKEQLERL